jgi:hypothetical protein
MAKNDNIIRDPVGMGRKGGKKSVRSRSLKRQLRETKTWADVESLFEKVVVESINSRSPTVRRKAAKDFGEFIKPKKREVHKEGEEKVTVNIIYGQPTEANAKNHPTS